MSANTAIEWTDRTWNPVVGCTKVSQGCKHCYAKTLHDKRHKAFRAGKLQNIPQYAHPFETVQTLPARLKEPMRWRKPARVFVNSLSDLFHEAVPDAFIFDVFSTMAQTERHTYQILTKRPDRMLRWFTEYLPEACSGEQPAETWPLPNVWLGVSVENQAAGDERIPLLIQTPAAIRFLSCEPLLGPVDLKNIESARNEIMLPLAGLTWKVTPHCLARTRATIDWVIVGGESGKGARPMNLDWARRLRDECQQAGIAYFLKQLGGVRDKRGHDAALLDGVRHLEFPKVPA